MNNKHGNIQWKVIVAVVLNIFMLWLFIDRVFYDSTQYDAPFFGSSEDVQRKPLYRMPSQETKIDKHPMVEFNFMTREQIYQLRMREVEKYPQLVDGDYSPCRHVFGQIVDNRPWWGINGVLFHGPGPNSIDGPSKESRYVMNPFLFIGLIEPSAYIIRLPPGTKPEPYYPRLEKLIWLPDNEITVKYDLKRFFDGQQMYNTPDKDNRIVDLVAYNARDFGLHWLYVDESSSVNVEWFGTSGQAARIRQFIHLGGSCGYPGGGNNLSPYQRDLQIRVPKFPATAHIRLWHNRPDDINMPPDLSVNLHME